MFLFLHGWIFLFSDVGKCSKVTSDLGVFAYLISLVTSEIFDKLTANYIQLSFGEVLQIYNLKKGAEKQFLDLLMVQGKNNVDQVKQA